MERVHITESWQVLCSCMLIKGDLPSHIYAKVRLLALPSRHARYIVLGFSLPVLILLE